MLKDKDKCKHSEILLTPRLSCPFEFSFTSFHDLVFHQSQESFLTRLQLLSGSIPSNPPTFPSLLFSSVWYQGIIDPKYHNSNNDQPVTEKRENVENTNEWCLIKPEQEKEKVDSRWGDTSGSPSSSLKTWSQLVFTVLEYAHHTIWMLLMSKHCIEFTLSDVWVGWVCFSPIYVHQRIKYH